LELGDKLLLGRSGESHASSSLATYILLLLNRNL
jgi:hypothetical protein